MDGSFHDNLLHIANRRLLQPPRSLRLPAILEPDLGVAAVHLDGEEGVGGPEDAHTGTRQHRQRLGSRLDQVRPGAYCTPGKLGNSSHHFVRPRTKDNNHQKWQWLLEDKSGRMEGESEAKHKVATKTENFEEEENAAEEENKSGQNICGAENNIHLNTFQEDIEAVKKKVGHPTKRGHKPCYWKS